MCHHSECKFWLCILKSNGKFFDGTVSWSSPVRLLGSDDLDAQHKPLLCVFHNNVIGMNAAVQ